MSRTEELIQIANQFSAHNYHPLPVVLNRGMGSKVWDVEGKEYLDFLSCYSALNFGHQHPKIVSALKNQLERLSLSSRAFFSEEHCLFSKELAEFTGLEMVLPMNSGAEAVETALKTARKWGYEKKKVPEDKAHILALENNFHGRTISIVSFSSEPMYREGYGPFTPAFSTVAFDDIPAVAKALRKETVAIIAEPIQAEAGILVPKPGYLKALRELCDKENVLLILDEIQTGFGRTGKNFCFQYENILPDILTLGKSLGGGLLPISAAVARRDVMDVIGPGEHGSTFGGNPLACAVARASLRVIQEEKLPERALEIGKKARAILGNNPSPLVKEIRGMGALLGIELKKEAGGARKYCEALARDGVLCKETHEHTIRIAPPLTISDAELEMGIEQIKKHLATS